MNLIDLRSDTVTRPTPGMRKAMAEAEVGDDVFGDDPTVRALEERVAELLGLPFGLFTASGSQANQLAVGAQCRPGDELLAEAGSHSLNFEGGAVSALWGVQPRALEGERGLLSPEQIGPAVRPLSEHYPRTRMLALENTHNRGGGTVWPIDRFRAVVAEARARGLLVHLDGARLFNAQARNGVRVSEYARLCDTGRWASWPRPACTRWTTTWSGWGRTTRTPGGWRAGWRRSPASPWTPPRWRPTWCSPTSRCRRRTRSPG